MKKEYDFTGKKRGKFYRPKHLDILFKKNISGKPIILDGGMGTSLYELGLPLDELPIHWNLSHPDLVKKVHLDFIKSGSQIIFTNTFTGKPERKLIEEGIKIAHQTRLESKKDILIGVSIGPGKNKENYEKIFEILRDQKFDLLILETQYSLEEILLALNVYFQSNLKDSPIGLSVTVDEFSTLPDKTTIPELIESIKKFPINILGLNCSFGPASMYPAAHQLKKHWSGLSLIKPNLGLPEIKNEKLEYSMSEENYIQWIKKYKELDFDFIGGCCGVHHSLISKIRAL